MVVLHVNLNLLSSTTCSRCLTTPMKPDDLNVHLKIEKKYR